MGASLKPPAFIGEGESMVRMTSLTEGPAALLRSPSKSLKVIIKTCNLKHPSLLGFGFHPTFIGFIYNNIQNFNII